jgi:hypothetical protein
MVFGILRPGRGLLVMLAMLAGPAMSARAAQVSCDGFALGYTGEAKEKKCSVEDTSTGGLDSQAKILDVVDQTFSLYIEYQTSGFRTYMPAHSATELASGLTGFDRLDPLGAERQVRGFDVYAFKGVPKGKDYALICALFSRYSGNPGNYEFPGGPGAKNMLYGVYCADPGFLTPAQQGAGFYTMVDLVISKLRLPSSD